MKINLNLSRKLRSPYSQFVFTKELYWVQIYELKETIQLKQYKTLPQQKGW